MARPGISPAPITESCRTWPPRATRTPRPCRNTTEESTARRISYGYSSATYARKRAGGSRSAASGYAACRSGRKPARNRRNGERAARPAPRLFFQPVTARRTPRLRRIFLRPRSFRYGPAPAAAKPAGAGFRNFSGKNGLTCRFRNLELFQPKSRKTDVYLLKSKAIRT